MHNSENLNLDQFNENWKQISDETIDLAKKYEGNIEALLSLLRLLEGLHKEIRDGLFQAALPDNRQDLYSLLKDIEASGGWPYIYRGNLKDIFSRLSAEDANSLLNRVQVVQEYPNLPKSIKDE